MLKLRLRAGRSQHLAGLDATARSFGQRRSLTETVSGDASAVVDSGWEICFHWGFGSVASASLPPAL